MSAVRRSQPRATHVTVMGHDYVLTVDMDPEYVEKIASFVNARMKALHERTVGLTTTRLAVLTAMNIADVLFTLRSEVEQAERLGRARCDEIESRINSWLEEKDSESDQG